MPNSKERDRRGRRFAAEDTIAPPDEAVSAPPAYRISRPRELASGVVFSSPHSGRYYPPDFVAASRLEARALRASEDAFVDDLFSDVVDFGAPLIAAVAPRAYIDLNRAPGDLDPVLIDGASARPANARVAAGLGVIPRIVAEGVPIYHGRLSLEEARQRLSRWHAPYHRGLVEQILQARRRFDRVLLIDCHSMPSGASAGGGRFAQASANAPEIVLGDRFGASADPDLVDDVERAFASAGFRVARNAPFAGGYITERYGRPSAGVSALQIEIDRGLYLDQSRVSPGEGFAELKRALRPVIERICDLITAASSYPKALAAE